MEDLRKKTVEELQKELRERGKYYFPGFGANLQTLILNLRAFERNATFQNKSDVQNMLNEIVKRYKTIPFKQITNHPDYVLLLEIREKITQLIAKVEDALMTGKGIDECFEIIKIIGDKGQEYRARLTALLKQQPGHENDVF
jgi:hypothetical protein